MGKQKKDEAIMFRLQSGLKKRFEKALEREGLSKTEFLVSKVQEFCSEVEAKYGEGYQLKVRFKIQVGDLIEENNIQAYLNYEAIETNAEEDLTVDYEVIMKQYPREVITAKIFDASGKERAKETFVVEDRGEFKEVVSVY